MVVVFFPVSGKVFTFLALNISYGSPLTQVNFSDEVLNFEKFGELVPGYTFLACPLIAHVYNKKLFGEHFQNVLESF